MSIVIAPTERMNGAPSGLVMLNTRELAAAFWYLHNDCGRDVMAFYRMWRASRSTPMDEPVTSTEFDAFAGDDIRQLPATWSSRGDASNVDQTLWLPETVRGGKDGTHKRVGIAKPQYSEHRSAMHLFRLMADTREAGNRLRDHRPVSRTLVQDIRKRMEDINLTLVD